MPTTLEHWITLSGLVFELVGFLCLASELRWSKKIATPINKLSRANAKLNLTVRSQVDQAERDISAIYRNIAVFAEAQRAGADTAPLAKKFLEVADKRDSQPSAIEQKQEDIDKLFADLNAMDSKYEHRIKIGIPLVVIGTALEMLALFKI